MEIEQKKYDSCSLIIRGDDMRYNLLRDSDWLMTSSVNKCPTYKAKDDHWGEEVSVEAIYRYHLRYAFLSKTLIGLHSFSLVVWTMICFPYVGFLIIPIFTNIFQRGSYSTANQSSMENLPPIPWTLVTSSTQPAVLGTTSPTNSDLVWTFRGHPNMRI